MKFKTALTTFAVAAAAPFVFAQTTETTVTTTTGAGTVTEWAPGERVVLKESTGPVRYRVRKDVSYVTKSGRVLTADEVQTRIRVGSPLSVHYVKEGEDMYVNRFVLDDDDIDIDVDD